MSVTSMDGLSGKLSIAGLKSKYDYIYEMMVPYKQDGA